MRCKTRRYKRRHTWRTTRRKNPGGHPRRKSKKRRSASLTRRPIGRGSSRRARSEAYRGAGGAWYENLLPKFGKAQFTIPIGTSAGPAVPLVPVGAMGEVDPTSMACDATVKTSWAEVRTGARERAFRSNILRLFKDQRFKDLKQGKHLAVAILDGYQNSAEGSPVLRQAWDLLNSRRDGGVHDVARVRAARRRINEEPDQTAALIARTLIEQSKAAGKTDSTKDHLESLENALKVAWDSFASAPRYSAKKRLQLRNLVNKINFDDPASGNGATRKKEIEEMRRINRLIHSPTVDLWIDDIRLFECMVSLVISAVEAAKLDAKDSTPQAEVDALRLQAVQLRNAGKQAEALAVLRQSKVLQARIDNPATHGSERVDSTVSSTPATPTAPTTPATPTAPPTPATPTAPATPSSPTTPAATATPTATAPESSAASEPPGAAETSTPRSWAAQVFGLKPAVPAAEPTPEPALALSAEVPSGEPDEGPAVYDTHTGIKEGRHPVDQGDRRHPITGKTAQQCADPHPPEWEPDCAVTTAKVYTTSGELIEELANPKDKAISQFFLMLPESRVPPHTRIPATIDAKGETTLPGYWDKDMFNEMKNEDGFITQNQYLEMQQRHEVSPLVAVLRSDYIDQVIHGEKYGEPVLTERGDVLRQRRAVQSEIPAWSRAALALKYLLDSDENDNSLNRDRARVMGYGRRALRVVIRLLVSTKLSPDGLVMLINSVNACYWSAILAAETQEFVWDSDSGEHSAAGPWGSSTLGVDAVIDLSSGDNQAQHIDLGPVIKWLSGLVYTPVVPCVSGDGLSSQNLADAGRVSESLNAGLLAAVQSLEREFIEHTKSTSAHESEAFYLTHTVPETLLDTNMNRAADAAFFLLYLQEEIFGAVATFRVGDEVPVRVYKGADASDEFHPPQRHGDEELWEEMPKEVEEQLRTSFTKLTPEIKRSIAESQPGGFTEHFDADDYVAMMQHSPGSTGMGRVVGVNRNSLTVSLALRDSGRHKSGSTSDGSWKESAGQTRRVFVWSDGDEAYVSTSKEYVGADRAEPAGARREDEGDFSCATINTLSVDARERKGICTQYNVAGCSWDDEASECVGNFVDPSTAVEPPRKKEDPSDRPVSPRFRVGGARDPEEYFRESLGELAKQNVEDEGRPRRVEWYQIQPKREWAGDVLITQTFISKWLRTRTGAHSSESISAFTMRMKKLAHCFWTRLSPFLRQSLQKLCIGVLESIDEGEYQRELVGGGREKTQAETRKDWVIPVLVRLSDMSPSACVEKGVGLDQSSEAGFLRQPIVSSGPSRQTLGSKTDDARIAGTEAAAIARDKSRIDLSQPLVPKPEPPPKKGTGWWRMITGGNGHPRSTSRDCAEIREYHHNEKTPYGVFAADMGVTEHCAARGTGSAHPSHSIVHDTGLMSSSPVLNIGLLASAYTNVLTCSQSEGGGDCNDTAGEITNTLLLRGLLFIAEGALRKARSKLVTATEVQQVGRTRELALQDEMERGEAPQVLPKREKGWLNIFGFKGLPKEDQDEQIRVAAEKKKRGTLAKKAASAERERQRERQRAAKRATSAEKERKRAEAAAAKQAISAARVSAAPILPREKDGDGPWLLPAEELPIAQT